jgi:hypothetical protein
MAYGEGTASTGSATGGAREKGKGHEYVKSKALGVKSIKTGYGS